jgi:hypothetical protein
MAYQSLGGLGSTGSKKDPKPYLGGAEPDEDMHLREKYKHPPLGRHGHVSGPEVAKSMLSLPSLALVINKYSPYSPKPRKPETVC